jgi:hypothetical protein
MRAKEHEVMRMAIETGVRLGWNRAHKHDPEPADDRILDALIEAVCQEVGEWFLFDDVES